LIANLFGVESLLLIVSCGCPVVVVVLVVSYFMNRKKPPSDRVD